jgi:polar amino acid transport system ATP-binding protein
VISVQNLTKYFGTHPVLNNVSLTINRSEVTALVGPSGGGKSTLLRCLNGLETFHTGRIDIAGQTLEGTHGRPHPKPVLLRLRRDVGMVFQQFNLFPHLTALDNVMCGPRYVLNQAESSAEATARKLLDRVGLADKCDAKPANLSGGQQQRVAIARTLAVNPSVILFDEPTSALDPAASREVLAVMRDLANDGLTMIVVTHAMDFAEQATVVHKMQAGKIVRSGSPADVLAH